MILMDEIQFSPRDPIKRGPRPKRGFTPTEAFRSKERRAIKSATRKKNIAILDFETDPFDHKTDARIFPFLCVLYSDEFDPIIIWEEDQKKFIDRVIFEIENLPEPFTIYAHNGGKFDYMFLVHRLRGEVSFKGRGIMSAKIGSHELRDSFHIIPERLANFKKDEFDYEKMQKGNRQNYREAIIKYCINDCKYLLEIVKHMTGTFGMKISIGQMAQYAMQQQYKLPRLTKNADNYLRPFFFGGRVECLQGSGHWKMPLKLYDVNSMYPKVMADYQHPIGNSFTVRKGKPGPDTIFMELFCKNSGALVMRNENGTSANVESGIFKTTIWEYEVALKHNLISDIEIIKVIDFPQRSDFSKFVIPNYEKRIATKSRMKSFEKGTYEYNEAQKDDMLLKYILNNAWGKRAQNPEKYKSHYLCNPGEEPPREWWPNENGIIQKSFPKYSCKDYCIYEKPNPGYLYNHVGTGASITGAARSLLLDAIHNSRNAIYCDTDSLICEELSNVEIHPTKLGAWDLEKEIDEIIVCGKKLYAYRSKGKVETVMAGALDTGHSSRVVIKSKGVSGLEWDHFKAMLDNQTISQWPSRAPTMTRNGKYFYMRRDIRATAPRRIEKTGMEKIA